MDREVYQGIGEYQDLVRLGKVAPGRSQIMVLGDGVPLFYAVVQGHMLQDGRLSHEPKICNPEEILSNETSFRIVGS